MSPVPRARCITWVTHLLPMATIRNCTRVQAPDPSLGSSHPADSSVPMTQVAQTTRGGRLLIGRGARSSLDLRQDVRIAAWNVSTLAPAGYPEALILELKRYGIFIAGISESRLPDTGRMAVSDYSLFYSGESTHIHGVCLAVHRSIANSLLSWQPISGRLLSARFGHRHGAITFIVAYAPTNPATADTKDDFYSKLASIVQSVSNHDELILLGDFNAVSGCSAAGFDAVGPFGSGIANDNTHRLLTFCSSYHLRIAGSFFQRKDIDGITMKRQRRHNYEGD